MSYLARRAKLLAGGENKGWKSALLHFFTTAPPPESQTAESVYSDSLHFLPR
jgi:hypothetical protein